MGSWQMEGKGASLMVFLSTANLVIQARDRRVSGFHGLRTQSAMTSSDAPLQEAAAEDGGQQ
jgi:hypothetical protein